MPVYIHRRQKGYCATRFPALAKLMAGGVVLLTVLLVVSLLLSSLPVLAQAGTVLENADYVFPDVSGQGGAPDPAVWTTQEVGTVLTQGVPGIGWGVVDPDSASQLLYMHMLSFLSGDPANPNFKNTETLSARFVSSAVPDNSCAWADNAIGARVILDDGGHRVELALARDPGSKVRQVRLEGAPGAPVIPFPWDNDFPNTYEIARDTNGNFVVTLTNGDPNAPNRVVQQSFTAAQTAATSGIARVAWGMGLIGGGTTFWQEVHAEVFSAQVALGLSTKELSIELGRNASENEFEWKGTFTVPAGTSFDPVAEGARVKLSNAGGILFEAAVAPAKFTRKSDGTFKYESPSGTVPKLEIKLKPIGGTAYEFKVEAENFALTLNDRTQVTARLTVGTKVGTETLPLLDLGDKLEYEQP